MFRNDYTCLREVISPELKPNGLGFILFLPFIYCVTLKNIGSLRGEDDILVRLEVLSIKGFWNEKETIFVDVTNSHYGDIVSS